MEYRLFRFLFTYFQTKDNYDFEHNSGVFKHQSSKCLVLYTRRWFKIIEL